MDEGSRTFLVMSWIYLCKTITESLWLLLCEAFEVGFCEKPAKLDLALFSFLFWRGAVGRTSKIFCKQYNRPQAQQVVHVMTPTPAQTATWIKNNITDLDVGPYKKVKNKRKPTLMWSSSILVSSIPSTMDPTFLQLPFFFCTLSAPKHEKN